MLILGFIQCADGECPQAVSAGPEMEPELGGVTLFLILRAFASGSTALTGVEAVANGVQALGNRRSRNAAATLGVMGLISITMFLGISTSCPAFRRANFGEALVDQYGTVISQIGRAAFNGGIGFWMLQVFHRRRSSSWLQILPIKTSRGCQRSLPATASCLASSETGEIDWSSQTGFSLFGPRSRNPVGGLRCPGVKGLSSCTSSASSQSFTLSQTGMVRHLAYVLGKPVWRRSVVINGIGAVTTGV